MRNGSEWTMDPLGNHVTLQNKLYHCITYDFLWTQAMKPLLQWLTNFAHAPLQKSLEKWLINEVVRKINAAQSKLQRITRTFLKFHLHFTTAILALTTLHQYVCWVCMHKCAMCDPIEKRTEREMISYVSLEENQYKNPISGRYYVARERRI